jgi:hypothetical protein
MLSMLISFESLALLQSMAFRSLDEFRPPGGHASNCYFAPSKIVTKYDPSTSRKRSSHPVFARPPPSKRKRFRCSTGIANVSIKTDGATLNASVE